MTIVAIGGTLLPLAHASEAWVRVALSEGGRRGEAPCVRVDIEHENIRLCLATPACGVTPDDRDPNEHERRIIESWQQRGLHTGRVDPDELVAFLGELRELQAGRAQDAEWR